MIKIITRQSTNKDVMKRIERQEKLLQKLVSILVKKGIIKDEISVEKTSN